MKTAWRVICSAVPGHSEHAVFILQYKVLVLLRQSDKTSHLTKWCTAFVPLSVTAPSSFSYYMLHFCCLNYFCEYSHNLLPHSAFTIALMDSAWPKKQLPFIRGFCFMPLGQRRIYDSFFCFFLSFPGTNATLVLQPGSATQGLKYSRDFISTVLWCLASIFLVY